MIFGMSRSQIQAVSDPLLLEALYSEPRSLESFRFER